jgi:gliding motility-associated-like protein
MSNENNIQNFDNFFKESFGNFQPEPPAGVFEAVQSQLGTATAGSSAGTAIAGKAAQWGIAKIIVGSVAAIAVAATIYVASTNSTSEEPTPSSIPTTENTATSGVVNETPNTAEIVSPSETSASNTADGNSLPHTTTGSDNGRTVIGTTQANGGNSQPPVPTSTSSSGDDNNKGGVTTVTPNIEKMMVPMYVSSAKACPNELVTLTIADDLSKNTYKINFGDGATTATALGKSITHKYAAAGTYKITAVDIKGLKMAEQTLVIHGVKTRFTVENTDKASFKFNNITEGAYTYNWFFGDNEQSTQHSPVHTYKSFEPKEYRVKLVAMDHIGCVDSFVTTVKQTYTYEDLKPIIPNVFSPNGDGINDKYDIGIRNEELYHLVVTDRSGSIVFESLDKENTWDGRNQFTGAECPATAYRVVFVYKIRGFGEQKVNGTVTIKR